MKWSLEGRITQRRDSCNFPMATEVGEKESLQMEESEVLLLLNPMTSPHPLPGLMMGFDRGKAGL